ncbi:hypothetical protein HBO97_24625, partial [Pseudomonas lundensis]
MDSVDKDDDDDFEKLMEEIDLEARQAANAYFEELYEASHGYPSKLVGDEISDEEISSLEHEPKPQRKGGLKFKLAA